MRLLPAELKGTELRTCLCVRLTARDGRLVAGTDHDQTVAFRGDTYEPGLALEASGLPLSTGVQPESAALAGRLDHEGLTASDLKAGVWTGARVDVYRVDWSGSGAGVWLWSGRLSEVGEGVSGFRAECLCLKADLERTIGRRFSRVCDAELGDGRCGVTPGEGVPTSCNKRFSTCRDVFGNMDNFRGFPFMPGVDFVIAGPSGSGNDGASLGLDGDG